MIELKEYCDQHGVSVDTGRRRIKSGEWKSILQNGKYFIVTDKEEVATSGALQGARLKEVLTAMQIKKIQQQLKDGQDEIRRNYKGEIIQYVAECLAPLRECLLELNLNEQQTLKVNECIATALKRLDPSSS